jgi:hypothetical protein
MWEIKILRIGNKIKQSGNISLQLAFTQLPEGNIIKQYGNIIMQKGIALLQIGIIIM